MSLYYYNTKAQLPPLRTLLTRSRVEDTCEPGARTAVATSAARTTFAPAVAAVIATISPSAAAIATATGVAAATVNVSAAATDVAAEARASAAS